MRVKMTVSTTLTMKMLSGTTFDGRTRVAELSSCDWFRRFRVELIEKSMYVMSCRLNLNLLTETKSKKTRWAKAMMKSSQWAKLCPFKPRPMALRNRPVKKKFRRI